MNTSASNQAAEAKITTPYPASNSPVPSGLLRELHEPCAMPYEMRIIRSLVFRVFASPDAGTGYRRTSYAPGCCIYPMSGPLFTQCEHYCGESRVRIKYRMGFAESYANIPEEIVSGFVSSNHASEFFYDNIMAKYVPSFRSPPFLLCVHNKPSSPDGESLRTIREYVPCDFRTYLEDLLTLKRISVRLVRSRKTKCGDHQRLASGEHLITVNETANQLSFLFTLLHELAHAFAPRTADSTPHDRYWKLMFGNMLVDCVRLFPKELTAYVTVLACNPPHSKDICEDYIVAKCGSDDFREHSVASIGLLRTRLELEKRFGMKLSDREF